MVILCPPYSKAKLQCSLEYSQIRKKDTEAAKRALLEFLTTEDVTRSNFNILVYSDNVKGTTKACSELTLRHDTSVAHQPQTNGIAEASIKRVKEGLSCLLFRSGLSYKHWAEAGSEVANGN